MPARHFPDSPNIRQLKQQAKDLLRAWRAGDPAALADFQAHQSGPTTMDRQLADAQLVVARGYGASSWVRLLAICRLIDALKSADLDSVRHLVLAEEAFLKDEKLPHEPAWRPAMRTAATRGLERIVTMLRQAGARDVDEVRARPELASWLRVLRVLGGLGATFPPHAIGGAVESLAGANFAFMVEVGSAIEDEQGDWRSRVALTLETYARNPSGKHAILETIAAHGIPLPDTPPMAVHRGRIDLLEQWLRRDPGLLHRTFPHEAVFPPELGCHADHSLALVGASLDGATLLHIAADYEEYDLVRWLLDRGTDPNVRAAVDAEGFGGFTALFNCVVTYNAGRRDDRVVTLLLDRGANPNARASLKKRLPFARDKSVHEYRDVTPLGWALQFHDQSYVSEAARRAIGERGGTE